MYEKVKLHLEEIFGTLVGVGSSIFHIFQHQQIHIVEGCLYTFFISIFGLTLSHYYKKFLIWIDSK